MPGNVDTSKSYRDWWHEAKGWRTSKTEGSGRIGTEVTGNAAYGNCFGDGRYERSDFSEGRRAGAERRGAFWGSGSGKWSIWEYEKAYQIYVWEWKY